MVIWVTEDDFTEHVGITVTHSEGTHFKSRPGYFQC